MNIALLKILHDVGRLGSFAAVARLSGLDPSSVSRSVAQAENELGIRLFQRSTRRVTPTVAGARFLNQLSEILDAYDCAVDEVQGAHVRVEGRVRLTASIAFGERVLVPLLAQFREAYPDVTLDLMLTDANVDLVADGVDLALRLGPTVKGDVICVKLAETRYRVCATPTYLNEAPPLRQPSDLIAHPTLRLTLDGFRSHWRFRTQKRCESEVPVSGPIVMSNALALRSAVLRDLGPALLAEWLIRDDLVSGRLVDVFPKHEVTATTFDTAAWLLYPSRSFLPARVRATIAFLREEVPRLCQAPRT